MLETFKARLKAKSKAAGANLSQARIDALADKLDKKNPDLTEEAEHDTKIDDLYDADDFKEIGSRDDYQRAKDAKDKKDKADKDKKDSDSGKDDKPKEDDMPAWAKTLLTEVQTLKADKAKSTMQEKLAANDKLKAIPKQFLKGRPLPEKDEDIEAWVTDAENDYKELTEHLGQQKQEEANDGFASSSKPKGSQGNNGKKVVDPVFDAPPKKQ